MFSKLIKKASPPPSRFPNGSGFLKDQYYQRITDKSIRHDPAQIIILEHLQKLLENLLVLVEQENQSTPLKFLAKKPEKCRSLYLYGGVGQGKSMLMELFYQACPIEKKRRVHFNTFMLEVHAFIHRCHKLHYPDAIARLAKNIRQSAILLCFDEFHVTDIADAMILGRLFSQLFDLGVVTVMTSNRHPNELYQGGLQREQFLFFIKILEGEADIIELGVKKDFRLDFSPGSETPYHFPLDDQAIEFIDNKYNELTNFSPMTPIKLTLLGRGISLTSAYEDVALTSFDELCVDSLGSADYLQIADKFKFLIIRAIPKLTAEKRNEAKRFVTLIDALYEHKVKLICSAEVAAHDLYTEGDGSFEFGRTVSRLIEMQSEAYWQSPHIKSAK
jgi:cell division protein ZapE